VNSKCNSSEGIDPHSIKDYARKSSDDEVSPVQLNYQIRSDQLLSLPKTRAILGWIFLLGGQVQKKKRKLMISFPHHHINFKHDQAVE